MIASRIFAIAYIKERMFKMDFDKYKNTKPYPVKPLKPRLNPYHSSEDVIQYSVRLKEYESEILEWQGEVSAYHKTDVDLYVEFRQDLFNELDIADNPKRERLFSIAWDMGLSAGCSEVYSYASQLVDLIKD
jgi:hypothetical protein